MKMKKKAKEVNIKREKVSIIIKLKKKNIN